VAMIERLSATHFHDLVARLAGFNAAHCYVEDFGSYAEAFLSYFLPSSKYFAGRFKFSSVYIRAGAVQLGGIIMTKVIKASPHDFPVTERKDYPTDQFLGTISFKNVDDALLVIMAVDDQMDVFINSVNIGPSYGGTTNQKVGLRDSIKVGLNVVEIVSTDYGPGGNNWWTCGFYFADAAKPDQLLCWQGWTYQRLTGGSNEHASVTFKILVNILSTSR